MGQHNCISAGDDLVVIRQNCSIVRYFAENVTCKTFSELIFIIYILCYCCKKIQQFHLYLKLKRVTTTTPQTPNLLSPPAKLPCALTCLE